MELLKRKFFLLFVSLILFSACDENPPIPDQKFLEVYVDILVAQDTTSTIPFSIDSLRGIILNEHNILPEQYEAMVEYYNSRPEKWMTFFDSVTVYVERLKLEAENQP